jgi:hypothetical protein
LCQPFRPWVLGLFFAITFQSLNFTTPSTPLLFLSPSVPILWLTVCVYACACVCVSMSLLFTESVSHWLGIFVLSHPITSCSLLSMDLGKKLGDTKNT